MRKFNYTAQGVQVSSIHGSRGRWFLDSGFRIQDPGTRIPDPGTWHNNNPCGKPFDEFRPKRMRKCGRGGAGAFRGPRAKVAVNNCQNYLRMLHSETLPQGSAGGLPPTAGVRGLAVAKGLPKLG